MKEIPKTPKAQILMRELGLYHMILRISGRLQSETNVYVGEQRRTPTRCPETRSVSLFLGITAVVLNNAVKASNFKIVRIVGGLDRFISLAFLVLEKLNETFVSAGRDALKAIEADPPCPSVSELKLLSIDRKRSVFLNHKLWFR